MRVSCVVWRQVRAVETVVGGVSPTDFVREYQLAARPALFQQLVVARSPAASSSSSSNTVYWPALRGWSHVDSAGCETLAGLSGHDVDDVIVPVEVSTPGHGYTSASSTNGGPSWQRLEMPMGVFLDAFVRNKVQWAETDRKVGYMAQFDLLSACPRLAQDAPGLPHTRAGPKQDREQWRSNTWIGPAHTFTPLHRDPYHNLFVQVVGSKRVHLLPPTLSETLLPAKIKTGSSSSSSANTVADVMCEQDLLQPDATRSPHLHAVLTASALTQAVLHPGDVLYIPHGWLHCVHSLSTSVSVNFWYR